MKGFICFSLTSARRRFCLPFLAFLTLRFLNGICFLLLGGGRINTCWNVFIKMLRIPFYFAIVYKSKLNFVILFLFWIFAIFFFGVNRTSFDWVIAEKLFFLPFFESNLSSLILKIYICSYSFRFLSAKEFMLLIFKYICSSCFSL